MNRLSKKQLRKKIDKKCFFCDCADYELLDVHRIIPGEEGGKYTDWNMLVLCCKCHRKVHAGIIKILGKYQTTCGIVVNYINEENEEKWKQ